ncbi:hypothetical protein MMC13_005056 [Lambiella insularis]|nr:hypothetical protein [Lambiella insularis]
MVQNKSLIFSKPPTNYPIPGEHLTIQDRPIDLDTTSPPPNGLLTQQFYASLDPYLRGKMRAPSVASYSPPFPLNEPLVNRCVARVLKSDTPAFHPGDLVVGTLPIAEYAAVPAAVASALKKLDNPYHLPPSVYVGALGMPGLTAYASLYEIGKPKRGETIFVSAASGAVGQLVGQLAKHEGLRVVGSVGSDEKLRFITEELGFDGGFNYKKEKPAEALKRLAPKGVDIYYDNVGGEQLQAALDAMTDFGRVVACGMVSEYNTPLAERYGVTNLFHVVGKKLTIRGFIVVDPDMGPKYSAEFQENVAKWIHEGSFKAKEHVTEGMDNAATALVGMLKGENFGKAVLKIAEL